ncbi:MAG: hypothetical protein Q9170_005271 [Blastenia crenularia]
MSSSFNELPKHVTGIESFKLHVDDESLNDFKQLVQLSKIPKATWESSQKDRSFLEFLPMMALVRAEYTPETLPYHLIVPSLPGYTLSEGPGPSKPFKVEQAASILDALMRNLGFDAGYLATGGDIGSGIARHLGVNYSNCKAVHINYCAQRTAPPTVPLTALNDEERTFVQRGQTFMAKGSGYAMMHGTRPSTIALVLSSNPLALLAWIGEKLLTWTDEDPSIDTILEMVSLYWFTDTMSRCLYPYRQFWDGEWAEHTDPKMYIKKPLGYSLFPKEINPIPRAWVATTGDLVWFRQHESGGHFAALEKPEEMKGDIEDFLGQLKKSGVDFVA